MPLYHIWQSFCTYREEKQRRERFQRHLGQDWATTLLVSATGPYHWGNDAAGRLTKPRRQLDLERVASIVRFNRRCAALRLLRRLWRTSLRRMPVSAIGIVADLPSWILQIDLLAPVRCFASNWETAAAAAPPVHTYQAPIPVIVFFWVSECSILISPIC